MRIRNAKSASGLMSKMKLNFLIILNQRCLSKEFTKVFIILNVQVTFLSLLNNQYLHLMLRSIV